MTPKAEVLEIRCNQEKVRFSRELLDKYNVAGPRYTSYPTAPEFREDFGPAEMAAAFAESNEAGRRSPLSLYMHLPFCERLCLFCGCNVVINRNHEVAVPYLDHLKREIDDVSRRLDPSRPVIQFHWGGGTPTYLAPEQLEDLFEHARARFQFSPTAEIGVEMDPRVTTEQHVRTLRRIGFNRVSFGVQDFNPRVQETIRRIQPYEVTRELFDLCRSEKFESINVDLIYGLPHQTEESFARTIDLVIGLSPDRIAMYSYAHVPWLKKQQGSFARHIPQGIDKFKLFRCGVEGFTDAGFRYIGFDHFARPSDELCVAQEERSLTRNFQGYTTKAGADLVGLGVTSISSVGRVYAQNYRDLPSYYRAIDEQKLATMRGLRLSDDDVLRREVITRILCHCRLSKREIEERFGIRFDEYFAEECPRLEELERDGLVQVSKGEISVTLLGRLFLRVVGMAFDAYFHKRDQTKPLFSKTV